LTLIAPSCCVTAKIEVPRKSATRVTDVIESQANGGHGIVSGERGLRPICRWKGAWHTATRRGKRDKSRDSFVDCRKGTEGKGGKRGTKETEDVTWGPRDSQVLPKYENNKGIALKGTEV